MGKATRRLRETPPFQEAGKWTLLLGGGALGAVILLPVPGPAYLLGILALVLGLASGKVAKGENQRILGIVLAIIGILVQTVYLGMMFFHPGKG